MRFASAISAATDATQAVSELVSAVHADMTAGMVDLLVFFVTSHHADDMPAITDKLASEFRSAVLLGCTAEGTIGNDREIERKVSMSLLAASLPGVQIRPFHILQRNLEESDNAADWERVVAVAPESRPAFIALADPFQLDVHGLLDGLNKGYPQAPLVGGVASGGRRPGENTLVVNGDLVHEGAVGVSLTGAFELDTVVSQGCRPIGKPFVITKGERNIIRELGGKAALEQLQNTFSSLPERDSKLARESLLVGRVIDEYKSAFSRGDFLIHNIVGVDRNTGAIGVAGQAKVGATVQFHVRDAASADEDLNALIAPRAEAGVRGALLFSCNGRGTHMWSTANHDAGVIRRLLGPTPLAGFFCAGEFGPIGGRNFIHGFTASIALFRPRPASAPPEPAVAPDET